METEWVFSFVVSPNSPHASTKSKHVWVGDSPQTTHLSGLSWEERDALCVEMDSESEIPRAERTISNRPVPVTGPVSIKGVMAVANLFKFPVNFRVQWLDIRAIMLRTSPLWTVHKYSRNCLKLRFNSETNNATLVIFCTGHTKVFGAKSVQEVSEVLLEARDLVVRANALLFSSPDLCCSEPMVTNVTARIVWDCCFDKVGAALDVVKLCELQHDHLAGKARADLANGRAQRFRQAKLMVHRDLAPAVGRGDKDELLLHVNASGLCSVIGLPIRPNKAVGVKASSLIEACEPALLQAGEQLRDTIAPLLLQAFLDDRIRMRNRPPPPVSPQEQP